MKFNKKHLVAELAILLGVASVTTVGLSAYIITGGKKSDTADTQAPTPIEIQNNVVNIKASVENPNLIFQPTVKVDTGKLTTDGTGDMTETLKITADAESEALLANKQFVISVKALDSGNQEVPGIETYVKTPAPKTVDATFTGSTKNYTASVELEWTWGDTFGVEGPCAWANSTSKEQSVETINSTMNLFKAEVAKVAKYVVTVELKEKQAQ